MTISIYDKILRKFNSHRIKYLLIGVSGVNVYVKDPARAFFTQDCDILVEPKPYNILKALRILQKMRYEIFASRELQPIIDLWLARKIILHRAVVTARKKNEIPIDIVTSGSGFSFKEWDKNKKFFTIERIKVPVGDLAQLLRAKQNSNREKDRKFLALYKIQIKEMLKEEVG